MSGGERARSLGRWGEEKTAEYLQKRGFTVISRNWRCRFGEIDLIMKNEQYLCFTEVKLRKSSAFGTAAAFVDRRKQEKLRLTAELYLSEYPTKLQPRFDVAEVYAPDGERTEEPEIDYIENAF